MQLVNVVRTWSQNRCNAQQCNKKMHTVEANSHPLFYSMCKMNTTKAYLQRLQEITPTNEKNYKTEIKYLFLKKGIKYLYQAVGFIF